MSEEKRLWLTRDRAPAAFLYSLWHGSRPNLDSDGEWRGIHGGITLLEIFCDASVHELTDVHLEPGEIAEVVGPIHFALRKDGDRPSPDDDDSGIEDAIQPKGSQS